MDAHEPREQDEQEGGEGRVPDLHLDRIERLARNAPGELARRADEAIARRVPVLAPSSLRRRVRRRTVALLVLLGLMALLTSAWTVLRETTILRAAMEAQLSERFGGQVDIREVRWDGWDRIAAEGLSLRAPGWPGDAGVVATMDRAQVVFSPWKVMLGRIELVDMEIDGLTLRIVERADRPGEISLLALRPKPGRGAGVRQPSSAMLRDLRLQFCESAGDALRMRAELRFDADFSHDAGDAGRYRFTLEQRERDGVPVDGSSRIRVTGSWDERDFFYDAELASMPIDARTLDFLPITARRWARRAELAGRIERARIAGTPSEPLRTAEVVVRDVSFRERDAVRELEWRRIEGAATAPIRGELGVQLAEGTVSLAGAELRVSARGAALSPGAPGPDRVRVPVDLEAALDLSVAGGIAGALDADDGWLERAVAATPFSLSIRAHGLDARPGDDGTPRRVELPAEAALALSAIGASDWAADVDVRIRRGLPRIAGDGSAEPAPIEVRGTLVLEDGRIEHPAFPYGLTGVRGRIDLTPGRLALRGVSASGSGTTRLSISGEIGLEGDDPGWELRVEARGLELDESLRRVVREPPGRTIVESLLDTDAWSALAAEGIVDPASRPGGTIDADIEVRHEAGAGERTEAGGRIALRGVRLVLDAFPYPMEADGSLTLTDAGVEIDGDGLAVRTFGGGTGTIDGRIDLPRVGGRRIIRTFIDFAVDGDRVSPALLAAIPPSFESKEGRPPGWPGRELAPISRMLTELGLSATLSARGSVRTRPDESDAVRTTVRLAAGSVVPTAALASVLRENGLSWPGRMTLEDVSGTIIADADMIRVEGASARHFGGTARASGGFSPDGRTGILDVELRGFPLERELVRIAEGPGTEGALAAWDALRPAGRFDAEVSWIRAGGRQDTYAHVRPLELTLADSVPLRVACGDLWYRNGELRLDSFDLRGPDTDDSPLAIVAHGTVLGASPDFRASVEGLSMSSPIVPCALRAAGASDLAEILREWRIEGAIDAEAALPGPRSGGPWQLVAVPTWLRGERDERPFEIRRQSGELVVGPGSLRADGLVFSLDHGFVTIDGRLDSTPRSTLAGEILLDACVAGGSRTLPALLPATVSRVLEEIEFGSTGPIWATDLRVAVDLPREGAEIVSVNGDLGISGASFLAGVGFEGMDGTLSFDVASEGGRPVGTVGFAVDQLRAVGRRATSVGGTLVLDREADLVRLEGVEADLLGGRVSARGGFHPVDGWEIRASCANVDFARFISGEGPLPEGLGSARHGSLSARIDARGIAGDPASRRGSGRVAVRDARMMEFPLGLSLLQLTQLMLPLNASMDRAWADFELDGTSAAVRDFGLSCGTLRLEGSGTVRTDDWGLALRMRSRGTLPLLSDLYGAVADQLFVIDVGGTLNDPRPRLTPIPVLAPGPAPAAPQTSPEDTQQ